MSALQHRRSSVAARRSSLGGTAGNELLTIAAAVVLMFLLLAEGGTLLDMRGLRTPHMVVGLVLIPPLLVKLASTGYRMARYYAGTPAYREKGPPAPALRLLAPLLVVTTAAIFASGIALLVVGHRSDGLLLVHKASFIVWSALFGIHFLSYLPRVVRSLRHGSSARGRREVAGAELRLMLLATSVGSGVALAIVLLPLVTGWHAPLHHEH